MAIMRSGISEPFEVSDEVIETLVRTGGYPHPLFQEGWRELGMRGRPLPGQGVLLLAGGALERTGAFDHAIALLGMDEVKFFSPAVVGDSLQLHWREIENLPWKSPDRELLRMEWKVINQLGDMCLEASARMLMRSRSK